MEKLFKLVKGICIVLFCFCFIRVMAENVNAKNVKSGWISKDGAEYYLNKDGGVCKNEFITYGESEKYYVGEDGKKQHGVVKTYTGKILFFDETTGLLHQQSGWIKYEGFDYYLKSTGEIYQNELLDFGDNTYYIGNDGRKKSGILTLNNKIYYFYPSTGLMKKDGGWINYEGDDYFFRKNGTAYKDEILKFGKVAYYVGKDGKKKKGLVTIGENQFYFDDKYGHLSQKSQWVKYNGNDYFTRSDGTIYKNEFLNFGKDTYYVGSNGTKEIGLTEINNTIYYFYPSNGLLRKQSGWITANGKEYFFNKNGIAYKNEQLNFGDDLYYVGQDGVKVRNKFISFKNDTYYFDNMGKSQKGKDNIGGVDCEFNRQGILIKYGGMDSNISITNLKKTSLGGIKINWSKVKYANSIEIYRSINNKNYQLIATVSANSTNFIDKEIPGKTFYYKIKCVKQFNDIKIQTDFSPYKKGQASNTVIIDVPYINQVDNGAPQGCEGASLLMALKGKGYSMNIGYKAFLNSMPKSTNPKKGFVHSLYSNIPTTEPHWIDTSPLAKYGRKYGKVYDITGATPTELKLELLKGNPIVVYVTSSFNDPIMGHFWYGDMAYNLHVVTLVGYNSKTGEYKIEDPYYKNLNWINKNKFEKIYTSIGKRAIVVR